MMTAGPWSIWMLMPRIWGMGGMGGSPPCMASENMVIMFLRVCSAAHFMLICSSARHARLVRIPAQGLRRKMGKRRGASPSASPSPVWARGVMVMPWEHQRRLPLKDMADNQGPAPSHLEPPGTHVILVSTALNPKGPPHSRLPINPERPATGGGTIRVCSQRWHSHSHSPAPHPASTPVPCPVPCCPRPVPR